MSRKLRMAMIGGGKDAFIGAVHRIALNMDGQVEMVAGALSAVPAVAIESGKMLFLDEDRIYTDYKIMLEKEAAMPADKRIDFVSIVTPNFVHFDPAMMALEKGFNVVIEKPITFTLEEAKQIKAKLDETGLTLLLCHTYTGYPMVKQAKQFLKSGALGKIRKIYVEYPQGWLSTFLEGTGNIQASWRTDPKKSGKAGAMGDIGTHAFNLAEYVTGLEVTHLCSNINTVVEGRLLDDDGAAFLKFNNGATGVLMATQIAAGEENNVKIRVYGEKGGIEWKQEDANTLLVKWLDKPAEIYRTGGGYNSSFAAHNTRVPAGHPEGYLEAFGNLYRNFVLTVRAKMNNEQPKDEWLDFPSVNEGIRGMAFVNNVIESGQSEEKWKEFTL
ncbi:Gfo/Idh/MocA family oxidoreductase [Lacibacter sp.]|jgi:predicted dehydrogenase|uniref:Gfo/Idh/MocA family protein n=1 Tax=Lacibacter sp. TaxID=1915409 RepID=UPI002B4B5AEA|nr:Gfo/Idh/MocA family oxidoreductase [Lacibacter sp.]HLP37917.1 Gfo/Idh/MocA family oxidoreductase [Lacibacter sp.]